ncbi:MAG: FAD binding domain-containing protein [Hyphomicrobiales bacterium]|nr:FAD binding domain-containing protein [Hyphomicrobiales bacterium]
MPQLAPVRSFIMPETIEACLDILGREGDKAVVLAGGQSIMPILKTRGLRPEVLLDLSRVERMRHKAVTGDGLVVGAMCCHRELWLDPAIRSRWSALADAAEGVGDRQVQNRGTLGGNLAFGTVVTDMKQVVMCLDAKLDIAGPSGQRSVSALEHFAEPENVLLAPGELLTSVRMPDLGPQSGSAYRKYGITANGRPVIGVAAMLQLDEAGLCTGARIVVGGLVPAPNVAKYAAQILVGKAVSEQQIASAAEAAAEEIRPQSDSRATSAYRRQLVRTYGKTVLALALSRAQTKVA